MDWDALKAALLRFTASMVLFGILIAVLFVLVTAVSMLPGVSELVGKVVLLAIMVAWTVRKMYIDAIDEEEVDDDAE